MSGDDHGVGVSHLVCTRCDEKTEIVRFDEGARIVCDCVLNDGSIGAVRLNSVAPSPEPWTFRLNGGELA